MQRWCGHWHFVCARRSFSGHVMVMVVCVSIFYLSPCPIVPIVPLAGGRRCRSYRGYRVVRTPGLCAVLSPF